MCRTRPVYWMRPMHQQVQRFLPSRCEEALWPPVVVLLAARAARAAPSVWTWVAASAWMRRRVCALGPRYRSTRRAVSRPAKKLVLVSQRLWGERRWMPSLNPRGAPARQPFQLLTLRYLRSRVLQWVWSVPSQPLELRSPAWVVMGLISALPPKVTMALASVPPRWAVWLRGGRIVLGRLIPTQTARLWLACAERASPLWSSQPPLTMLVPRRAT